MDSYKTRLGIKGRLTAMIITPDPDAVQIGGMKTILDWRKTKSGLYFASFIRDNAFVNQGLNVILDRYANIGGPPAAPVRIGVSSDNTAVTATTTTFGGTFRSSLFNVGFPVRAGQTTSFQSDFTKGSGAGQIDFSVRKLGLTSSSTDSVGGVHDIIGGAGVAPFNEPLTIDLTGTSSFTFRPQIDVTLIAI